MTTHTYTLNNRHTNVGNHFESWWIGFIDDYLPAYPKSARGQTFFYREVERQWGVVREEDVTQKLEDSFFHLWDTDELDPVPTLWPWSAVTPLGFLRHYESPALNELHVELVEAELLWLASPSEPFPHANLLAALDATS
jgi:hypothetical protein